MRARLCRVALTVSVLAAAGLTVNVGPATASPAAGPAQFNLVEGTAEPPEQFILTGALPLPQPAVGDLYTLCDGPSVACNWFVYNSVTGQTSSDTYGTCVYTTYTDPSTIPAAGTWALSCTGVSQGVATSFSFAVEAAHYGTSTTSGGGANSVTFEYAGSYQGS